MPPRRESRPAASRAKYMIALATKVYGDDWPKLLMDAVDVSSTTIYRWSTRRTEIPQAVIALLEEKVKGLPA